MFCEYQVHDKEKKEVKEKTKREKKIIHHHAYENGSTKCVKVYSV